MIEVPPTDPSLIRETLEKILASREFSTTARMRRFLQHIVERDLAELLSNPLLPRAIEARLKEAK